MTLIRRVQVAMIFSPIYCERNAGYGMISNIPRGQKKGKRSK